MLFRTRWGLRLRASGEKPAAAGTVGINVIQIRYRALFLAGLICRPRRLVPVASSTAGSFQMEMTAGKGFIALAAVIFGAWHPVGAFGAALVFGFADSIQSLLSILGVDVPPQLLNSVPYIVTIIVVAGVVGTGPRAGRGRSAIRAGLTGVSAGWPEPGRRSVHAAPTVVPSAPPSHRDGAVRDRRAAAAAHHRQRPGAR